MGLRRILAAGAVMVLMVIPSASSASPYNEVCGDGTPHGCLQHCLQYHGGVRNLDECYMSHYLV